MANDGCLSTVYHSLSEVAEEVLNQCMVTSGDNVGPRSPGYQVIYNYEFLDDFRDKYTQAQQRYVYTAIATSAYMVFHAEGLAGIELHYAA